MPNNLYNENLDRIKKAVAFERVDRIPFAPCGNASWARMKNIPMAQYINDFPRACTANLELHKELDADATQNTIFTPWLLPGQWLSKVSMPGEDLGDDEMWQVRECENMKQADYYDILENGFASFYERFQKERCGDPVEHLKPFFDYLPTADKRFEDAGLPCLDSFHPMLPFEYFCGGRSLEKFFVDDLLFEPELMDKVFERTMEYTIADCEAIMKATHPLAAWVGGWRTAPYMLSEETFDHYVWPYFKTYTDLLLKYNVTPVFHLDANWNRALPKFLEMPKQSCIMALDSATDIRLARQVLGDHMAILGDVPAVKQAFGTPKDIRDYVTGVLDDIGPRGYICASGCDIPSNAKYENVKAMADAAHDYPVK